MKCRQALAHREETITGRAAFQFISLGEQDVDRETDVATPVEHLLVIPRQRVPTVHHQDEASQRSTDVQIVAEMMLPLRLDPVRYLSIAEAGKVDEAAFLPEVEEIDLLGTARCLAGSSQAGLFCDGIQSAGFAGIRAPGEGDFGAFIGRGERSAGHAGEEYRAAEFDSHRTIFAQSYWSFC